MKRPLWLAIGAAIYAIAAWSVAPGFYDGYGGPQYDYVKPPSYQAASNTPPTSGSGTLQVEPDGAVAGGSVATLDQPIAQAAVVVKAGALQAPASGGPVMIQITPYDVPAHLPVITLVGNVYCFTANTTIQPGRSALIALMQPADKPGGDGLYRSPDLNGPWQSLGGQVDLNTYSWTASTTDFGCFAVGYPTPKPGNGPTLGGALPLVTAGLIVLVLVAGMPLALRRRLYNRR